VTVTTLPVPTEIDPVVVRACTVNVWPTLTATKNDDSNGFSMFDADTLICAIDPGISDESNNIFASHVLFELEIVDVNLYMTKYVPVAAHISCVPAPFCVHPVDTGMDDGGATPAPFKNAMLVYDVPTTVDELAYAQA
jgi:hypothetical protein